MSSTATPPERPAQLAAAQPGTSRPGPTRVVPAEIPGVNGLLTLAVFVVVVAALYLAREVLIPITLAMLLSFLLAPLASLLHRIRIPRVLSVIVAVILALGVILSLGGLIGAQIAGLANDVPRYEATIEKKVAAARGFAVSNLTGIMQGLGGQLQHAGESKPAAAPTGGQAPTGQAAKPVQVEVQQPSPSPLDVAMRILTPVVAPLSTTLIVLIVAIFILLQREDLRDRAIRLFGSADLHRTTTAMNDAAARLSRYFLTQLGVNTAFGLIITGGLYIIGVPSPPLWGVIGLLLRFVPYVGAWLAAAVPMALAAAVDPGWSMLAWTAALYAGVEFTMGQAVEPMLYGHSTGLSPFSVVVAATFWTWLWGPIGLILSTPLTLCLVVLGRHVDRLEFLDVLLGDRPALTPVESFYQRMLAGDADEAHEQAEQLLRQRPLSTYYDEVAVKGLQLAAADAMRGVLTDLQLQRVQTAARNLIHDLEAHQDVDPHLSDTESETNSPSRAEQAVPHTPALCGQAPPRDELAPSWRSESPVLCLAGRGPLDDSAAAMLAQLLSKHGIGARAAEHASASRDAIAAMDVAGVALVCINYLEVAGTPSHLRYMLRRLRQRMPGVPMLVGLWPATDEVLRDDRLRATVGADFYVSTLREAVEICLAEERRAAQPAAFPAPVPAAA